MKRYNPSEIEPKWQQIWAEDKRYEVTEDTSKRKFYVSGMFPYPSAAGMHVGHTFEHAIVDAVARFQRANGANVLNPMGWDAFGLPAENYAIKTGTPPAESTKANIAGFMNQLKRLGASIDWSREINTSDPEYYKWTQWIFTQLFEKSLAYQKEANQWWCPVDMTVLANEQVEGGKCWRCGSIVEKKSMTQWFFKITDYADALLEEIPALDWPEKIKSAQTNWIGRSEGAEIEFTIEGSDEIATVFTTRPDTIFGATFLVVAPEHPLVQKLTSAEQRSAVDTYVSEALKKSEIERMAEGKDKTGVDTGAFAINPATGERMPIWVADYVLWGYGTGAIMAVPAHDERDHEFAEKFSLPIIEVVKAPADFTEKLYHGEGALMNSGEFDGMSTSDAREKIVAWLEQQQVGRSKVTYKMRDWLVSRQRYWGAPIPIIHCPTHGAVAVPEADLPVLLPEVDDFTPKGQSALASVEDWVNTTCPTCGEPAKRETDTMDGYACSSWYLLRYTDPHNAQQAWNPKKAAYWTPIDMYVGGDHAVAHLLYVRFWSHVFYDMKLVPSKEPVKKLVYHGLIGAEDGRKMSKSLGNVVDPLEVIDQGYGADALRTFELFLGPINENSQWSSRGIAGVYRFLNRAWTLSQEYMEAGELPAAENAELTALRHRTVKKVTSDIHRLSFNTAIATLMEYVNELYKYKTAGFTTAWQEPIESLVQMLAVFAPHVSAELWQQLGKGDTLDFDTWPEWDESLTIAESMTIVVQVNGKVRAKLDVAKEADEAAIKAAALSDENVIKYLENKEPTKVIYIPGRLVSIVLK
ncbi:MAG TPA: leucine--tRNA ligase [Patescibacteria group bacterium]|jgi:leucyl-tRNA synthetase|nr:leucine--tRNA ligase [Patescibacteria group bacterium]